MKKVILFLILGITLLLTACTGGSKFKYVDGKVNIVATTTMLGDVAKQVGGEHVNVYTLMGVGIDPHSYKPKSSDRLAVKQADLVVDNGLHLEAQMGEVLQDFAKDSYTGALTFDKEDVLKDDSNNSDPHVWFNVLLWKKVAIGLSEKLQTIDVDNKESYQTLLTNYAKELDDLERYVKETVEQLSPEKRVLVTAHDAFQYFAHAYGFEVHAIQGISTETEASAADIESLAKLVADLKVKAIFVESSIPRETIQQVIDSAKVKGHTLNIGGELYSDSLGNGDDGLYVNAIKHNVDTIVNALK